MSLLALLALLAPRAAASEFREITLSDDRVIRGEVLASSDTGLRLQLHQGTAFVPYSDIQNIQDIDEAGWRGSDRVWTAAVSPVLSTSASLQPSAELATALVSQALGDFPGIELEDPGDAVLACGADPGCALAPAREAGLDLVVLGEVERPSAGDNRLKLTAVFTASDRSRASATIPWDAADDRAPVVALNALYPVLGLEPDADRVQSMIDGRFRSTSERPRTEAPAEPPTAEPTTQPTEPAPGGLSRGQVAGLAFIPVPGFPSLYQRDLRRFGLSWIAVVPATAVYVGAAGASSVRRGQLLGLGLAGYYVTTVAVNQVMGIHSLESTPLISLEPQPGGGVAKLTVPLP